MSNTANTSFRVNTDGFFGDLYRPDEDKYPGKALICFSGSDGGIELGQTKLFKGDRGKNKEPGLKARLDSLVKTLEFVSR